MTPASAFDIERAAEAILSGDPSSAGWDKRSLAEDRRPSAPQPLAALLDGVAAEIRRYMAMPEAQVGACTLWVAHTYALDAADFTPYLHVHSPERECGKTTLLDVLQALARAGKTCDGMSPAALYRIVERDAPTLLLDELDTVFGAGAKTERAEALRGVLNSGFRRGGSFCVCSGDAHEPREFNTFCPKVLAGIGELPDTLASRSIPIRLERASSEALAGLTRLRGDRVREELAGLRDELACWAERHGALLRDADPEVPEALSARKADVCRPLLALADAAGGDWPARARAALVTLCAPPRAADDHGSIGAQLLADMTGIFLARGPGTGTPATWLSSAEVAQGLSELEGHPWPDFQRGQPITANLIARLLKRYGIGPKNRRDPREGGARVLKGYFWHDLDAPVRRYAPAALTAHRPPAASGAATAATAATSEACASTSNAGLPGATASDTRRSQPAEGEPPSVPPGSGVAVVAAPDGEAGELVEVTLDGVRRYADGSTEFTQERLAALRAQRRLTECAPR